MIEIMVVVSLKVFFTCLVAFIVCMVIDSIYTHAKDPVPETVKLVGGASVIIGITAIVFFLLLAIWQ